MFGELLESHARRQRRTGGVVLSVVTHVTIIGVATVVTARGAPAPHEAEKPVIVHFTPPPPPRPAEPQVSRVTSARPRFRDVVVAVTTVVAPTVVPVTLPPIDMTRGLAPDSIVVGARASSGHGGYPSRTLDLRDDAGDGGAWRGNDLLMRMTASAKPRYPENLRMAGIDGRVLVRFAVDTLGRIDPASIEIVSSTHELFTDAVRKVLGAFRFRPAESGGHRVRMLAEMPFEFSIDNGR